MKSCLTNATTAAPEIASQLAAQIQAAKAEFDANGPTGKSPVWADLKKTLPERFDDVVGANAQAQPIGPGDYFRLGRLLRMLDQIVAFVSLVGQADPKTFTAEQQLSYQKLRKQLTGGTYEDLTAAKRLIREMRQQVSPADIEGEITNNRVEIETSRNLVRQFEATDLRTRFLKPSAQKAAARDEFVYEWDFGHDGLTDKGSVVSHYFPEATEANPDLARPGLIVSAWRKLKNSWKRPQTYRPQYEVTVTLVNEAGKRLQAVAKKVAVRPRLPLKVRASFWMEVLRLSLALGIAAAGLVVGAREQLLKLDLLPAMIAVFLLGFGSDRVKDLFSPAKSSTEGSNPAAPATAPAAAPAAKNPIT